LGSHGAEIFLLETWPATRNGSVGTATFGRKRDERRRQPFTIFLSNAK